MPPAAGSGATKACTHGGGQESAAGAKKTDQAGLEDYPIYGTAHKTPMEAAGSRERSEDHTVRGTNATATEAARGRSSADKDLGLQGATGRTRGSGIRRPVTPPAQQPEQEQDQPNQTHDQSHQSQEQSHHAHDRPHQAHDCFWRWYEGKEASESGGERENATSAEGSKSNF